MLMMLERFDEFHTKRKGLRSTAPHTRIWRRIYSSRGESIGMRVTEHSNVTALIKQSKSAKTGFAVCGSQR